MRSVSLAGRIAAVGAVVLLIVVLAVVLFSSGGGYSVKAVFLNAGQLVKGNSVEVGGVSVGSVDDIALTPSGQAVITMSVDKPYVPLKQGTEAVIRQASLSGIAKRAILDSALHEIGQDIGRNAVLGGFDRSDAHLTRTNLMLDVQAWRVLADELQRLREWAQTLEAESKARLADPDHQSEVIESGLALMLYQKMPDVEELTRGEEAEPQP